MNIGALLKKSETLLSAIAPTPRLDAEILLAHTLNVTRIYLLTWPEKEIEPTLYEQYQQLLSKRSQGYPIAYLIGQREFWSRNFSVDATTLIPRPETEEIITTAMELFSKEDVIQVADLGTGSGAIAITLALECPRWQIVASDISDEALTIARLNAKRYSVNNLLFCSGKWCLALPDKKFHLIVSNPPYLSNHEWEIAKDEIIYEPKTALVAGPTGLEALTNIIECAYDFLQPQGWLVVEHGFQQGEAVQKLFAHRSYHAITTFTDLAGLARITQGQKI